MENTHPGKNPHGAGTVPAPQRVLFAMVGFFTIAFGQSRPSIRRIDLPESARKRHSDTNTPPRQGEPQRGVPRHKKAVTERNTAHKCPYGVSDVLADFPHWLWEKTPLHHCENPPGLYTYRGLPVFAPLSLAGSV